MSRRAGSRSVCPAVLFVLWGRPPPDWEDRPLWKYGRFALLALLLLGVRCAGWMLGAVPILLGVGITVMLRWRDERASTKLVGVGSLMLGAIVGVVAARSSVQPIDGYNAWVGAGADMHGPTQFPTFDALIEHIGHGLFPWTGIVVFGVARLFLPPPTEGMRVGEGGVVVPEQGAWRESGMRMAALLSIVMAFGFQSFHLQMFGATPFIAVGPLAIAAGLALRDAEREAQPWRLIAAGAVFFTAILMRDFLLFPKSSYAALGLPDGGPAFPTGATASLREFFESSGKLRSFFGGRATAESYFLVEGFLFILISLSALFQGPGTVKPMAWNAPYKWLRFVEESISGQIKAESTQPGLFEAMRRLPGLSLSVLRYVLGVLAVLMIVGGVALVTNARLTTPLRVAGAIVAATPIVIVVAVYGVITMWNFFAEFGADGTRIMYVPTGTLIIAIVIAHMFWPSLSRHTSPRDVWLTAARVRQEGEPVARYGGAANDPAPSFYTRFDVQNMTNEREAADWLRARSPRHLLVVNTGAEVFPPLNRAYRRSLAESERQNIPVLDATNSNLFLATSDLGDQVSHNPLDAIVTTNDTLTTADDHYHVHGRWEGDRVIPEPARLDDNIEFIGYNIDSPTRGNVPVVPVGGTFTITYHFHVLREVTGSYQIFVHVDGQCPRVNGDHDPAEGKYPVRFWLPGDYVHDVQRLTIPGYCRAGRYQVFIGFFQGDNRMHVDGGDHDHENRIVAATLDVR